ncbi:MAG TPA: methyltransferase domain-containing protein [bacterium]|nr:methyltransferase domain-containing protein [bacterium]
MPESDQRRGRFSTESAGLMAAGPGNAAPAGRVRRLLDQARRKAGGLVSHWDRSRERRYLQRLLDDLMTAPATRERVDLVLSVGRDDPRLQGVDVREERALPGYEEFRTSGWWKIMLTRYALGLSYCRDRCVLDSCCGLGWGSFLADAVAKRVIAVDQDPEAIKLALKLWPGRRTDYVRGSVLSLGLADQSVDVVLAMESIEHFAREDIPRFLDEIRRVLKPGGRLIGSSEFPETRRTAAARAVHNPLHLYILTGEEIKDLLKARFKRHHLFRNRLFFTARA